MINLGPSSVLTSTAAAPPTLYLFIARALNQKLFRIDLSKATLVLHFNGPRFSEKQHEHQQRQTKVRSRMAALDTFLIDWQQTPLRVQFVRRSQMIWLYQTTSKEWLPLGIVNNNDYSPHFHENGIITNLEVIRDLRTRLRAMNKINAKVQIYIHEVTGLSHLSTSVQGAGTSGQHVWKFADVIKVFVTVIDTPEIGHPLAPAIDYDTLALNRLV
ncbi:unnamed protein product [Mortierella alpina]